MKEKFPGGQVYFWLFIAGAVVLAAVCLLLASVAPRTAYGPVLHEETSEFSHIRIRGTESLRHLLFVTGDGKELLQSSVDLDHPESLQIPYTRALLASLFFRDPQERILIVGLGGGGMVGFFRENVPEWTVEAVEIDPAVIRVADEYFGVREEVNVRIHAEDAFEFLRNGNDLFDAIYMDAFLKPSVDRDASGKTARLKTEEFLRTIRERLVPDGVLACNLVKHRAATQGDIEALRAVFPTVKVIPVLGTGNIAVIASKRTEDWSAEAFQKMAVDLEKRLPVGISWKGFSDSLTQD